MPFCGGGTSGTSVITQRHQRKLPALELWDLAAGCQRCACVTRRLRSGLEKRTAGEDGMWHGIW